MLRTLFQYDSDLRLTAINVPNVQSLAFGYDAAERITAIANGMNGSWTQSLTYDALDRLTVMASGARSESYRYDADGNRTWQAINGIATTYTYAANSNRLVAASGGLNASYGYNAYGSLTTVNGVAAYAYDPFARLVNAGGAAFEVSAEEQRIRKSFAGSTTYFLPDAHGDLLAENVGGIWKDYVYLNGRLVLMVSNGGVYSVHGDQTGRAMVVTNMGPRGAPSMVTAVPPVPGEPPAQSYVAWASKNDPFDRNTVTGDPAFFPLGFPGQYWDAEDSLWHNGARDYDPTTGRYVESDPIGLGGGVNTYAYVGNNPINVIDPSGLIGYVCQKGNNVGINIPINFKGATPAEISAMSQAIASAWSGQFGPYRVVTTVTSVPSFNSAVNVVYVVQGRVDAAGGKISRTFGGQAGMWMSNPSYVHGMDYAHEAGHMLGLPDTWGTGGVMDNYPTSVGSPPDANDISNVLASHGNVKGCGCGG